MFVGYIPYIKDTINNKTIPHTFTWLIWVFTVGITFALQVKGGAGIGSLVTLVLFIVCFYIFILGLYKKNKDITWLDIIFLIFSLIALLLWLVAKQPVLSIVIIVIVDVLAFVPTIRKSWNNPHSETLSLFEIVTIRHALSIFALQQYNILTYLSPVASTLANLIFVIILIVRRKKLLKKKH
ncbi:hypothetical protein A2467_02600 [Candidatus Nomurabacteria bacterium RIFOXYC2_FULL_36_8]|nr:MAG: hypothetical protein UR97_C0007G0045 [Candidatus Nomurabacteria bacterium GW2011_GWE2_36_115]KKP93449.1 MAG: hypothetical protein US00_C0007G0071 [Candidatus Nomurabacteria bacterium GW2011_GWF2_36_126]KKP96567.1 MAG: hypothetical protein US04_C0001G0069 [Candidatus Nomurabacteria bacterium GW2011_GWD2_36_14]KKP99828.1 MAG: hypothetical protein US08_C0001G0511 [Candidatus Nomurabacteria bacterium GW2011_GWF2_36_19]KKQ05132.1 MAG: hypothetical protein US17_C0007G0045 [Candidatus Nomuraba